jgi:Carboxypeptidase regulatory-like domain
MDMTYASVRRFALFFVLISLFCGGIARAQTGTTSVRGTITDKSGGAIAGAKVTIKNVSMSVERSAMAGSTGQYEFLALPPGTYELIVERQGFQRYAQTNLQLLVNSPATQDVLLQVGSSTETVEVSADVERLNTTDASLGTAFNERQVRELPLEAGNVPELLSLQAGVTYTGNRQDINKDIDTRNGAVNGARSDQSNITLDGVDVNADTKGYAFDSVLPITQDSVQEFRVTTSNYNADEGRSSGAQVALVTKGGTNNFHGTFFETNRNTATSANDYFVKLAQLQSGAPNKPPKLIRNNFGAALGGPIKKDRLFFFANYEGHRQNEAQSVVRIVPSAAMQDGVIQYVCADPTQCSGGTVQGVTATHNVAPGNYALGPAQIKGMDPQGIGISNVTLPYLQSFAPFQSNDNSVGDGLNFVGYRFPGPVKTTTNWYIARVDYKITENGNHTIYWRGALRNDTIAGEPYLPGGAPEQNTADYSKGFSIGYSAVLRPNLVNNFRYGFTRQSYGVTGNQTQDILYFRGLNDNSSSNYSSQAYTNDSNYQVPVNNFVDDVSWVRGKHTWQFGFNMAILRNPQANNINSFSSASDNPSWLDTAAMANSGVKGHFDPAVSGFPAVDSGFGNNYDYPMGALVGMVTQVNAQYNFTHSGSTLSDTTPVSRRFAADSWEMYAQDQWKVTPTLTVTLGLRYSLFSPPWETNGLQVSPTTSLGTYFNTRGTGMLQGQPASAACCLSFDLAGPGNGKPGFYNWDKKDFGPHVAFAWAPKYSDGLLHSLFGEGKTVVRGGFGMVYDRLGPQLLATFDANGSFGLSTTLTNTGGVQTPATAPRATGLAGLSNIPTVDLTNSPMFAPPPSNSFPQTFPSGLNGAVGSYAVYWGMDNKLKTPYSYTLDFSVGRELSHGFAVQFSYVGRLSHRLLSQEDVAAPLDWVDPKTGVDYFTAVQALAKVYRGGTSTQAFNPALLPANVQQYWADLYPTAPAGGFRLHRCTGTDAQGNAINLGNPNPVIAAYDLFCGFSFNESTALQGIDQGFGIEDMSKNSLYPKTGPYTFVDPQFAALYAWRSIGSAAYNALQVNLQKHFSGGVQFDLNYTYSHSFDISSDSYRINAEGGLGAQVINPWSPNALRASSDFDLRHQINANWIVDFPFGRGKRFGSDVNGFVDALIGGWELSGLARWTSGFPVGVGNGAQWPTNWQLSGYATQVGAAPTNGAVKNPDGSVNIFGNAAAVTQALAAFQPDLPGQVGNRNTLRGNGFAGLDLGLSKRWKMPYKESHTLQFRWDVFNALNLTRFDVNSLNLSITNASNFGNYTGLLTNPRVMQFQLRYGF